MRDVARHAGVSVATVSRVLNGTGVVSADTRKRVEASVDTLNFVPSPSARAINSGRTFMVGALVPTLDHAIFARYLHALEEELALCGLSLVVATTGGNPELEAKRAQDLMNLGIEGLVVSGITRDPAFEQNVRRRALPVIATSYFSPEHDLPTIGYDNAEIALMALDHLVDLGHRNIAVMHGPVRSNDRTLARIDALQARLPTGAHILECPLHYEAAADLAKHVVQNERSVTALLCASDVLALGALFGLQSIDVSVPDDISLIGMEDLPASRTTSPAITSVRLPLDDMGRHTANAMRAWIEQGTRPEALKLPSQLILRSSTSPV
ncbi:LacI family DNA-binding transcriptional regulator [uncultured Tateyamaria sp.]|uniref:LacI family DNA-binding transcriptional regulator n=1 Tax=uncultured Tateyamaria sp. TaxID=455651 RepID=UPI00262AD5A6|nr:LacI family DNA-binding transcriptional regulator [uncultured Tateyamaria sp.]